MAVAWELDVNGVDLAARCDRGFALSQVAFPRASQLTFVVDNADGTADVQVEHDTVLVQGAERVFAGIVRKVTERDAGVTSHPVIEVECHDNTSLLIDDVVETDHPGGGSDADMIADLFGDFCTTGITIGGNVGTIVATMPAIATRGMTLFEALEAICKVSHGFFYVRYDVGKNLLYQAIRDVAAPWGLSDDPDGVTTFPYHDFSIERTTDELVNAVYVIGTGVADWVEDAGSQATYGRRRAAPLREPAITTMPALTARGNDYLDLHSEAKLGGGLKTLVAGLRAGMTVEVDHAGWGYAAEPFPIAQLDARPLGPATIEFTIRVGEPPKDLAELLEKTKEVAGQDYSDGVATGQIPSPCGDCSGSGCGCGEWGSGGCVDGLLSHLVGSYDHTHDGTGAQPSEDYVTPSTLGDATHPMRGVRATVRWSAPGPHSATPVSTTVYKEDGTTVMCTAYLSWDSVGMDYSLHISTHSPNIPGQDLTVSVTDGVLYGWEVDCIGGVYACRLVDLSTGSVLGSCGVIGDPFDTVGKITIAQAASGGDGDLHVELPDIEVVTGCDLPTPDAYQVVPPELVGTGDGTTTSFTTLFPYAPGSLRVWIDNLTKFEDVTEIDPATGAFDVTPAPKNGEVVRVTYKGAP